MDYKVIWSIESSTDLDEIAEYISKDSMHYASSFVQEILDAGNSLKIFPKRGRIVPEVNSEVVRELFVKEYRLIYKIGVNEVIILGIVHGRRDLEKLLSE